MLKYLSSWSSVGPVLAWAVIAAVSMGFASVLLIAIALAAAVTSAVHHAEIIAHRVGEPFGTLILALAVTVIEVGLILSLMAGADDGAATLARDTVIAAVMIILNGIIGICLLIGGIFHREQVFQQSGVSAALATICALTILSLVLPNFTVSEAGPVYSSEQLAFVAIISLILYGTFVTVQTVRHREYFLQPEPVAENEDNLSHRPSRIKAGISAAFLIAALGAVVLLAKELSQPLDQMVISIGAPNAIVGIMIAALVLLPEGVAAVRAALRNRIQTSLNLALGSALATIGLTIPAVSVLSLLADLPVALGLGAKGTVLLSLTLLVSTLSLANGRTTVLQGVVHLVIFGVYIFTTVFP